jgi:hypothetical protein
MSEQQPTLPKGVELRPGPGDQAIELVIRAADTGELAWRLHDLIPLIQSGDLDRLVEAGDPGRGLSDAGGQ